MCNHLTFVLLEEDWTSLNVLSNGELTNIISKHYLKISDYTISYNFDTFSFFKSPHVGYSAIECNLPQLLYSIHLFVKYKNLKRVLETYSCLGNKFYSPIPIIDVSEWKSKDIKYMRNTYNLRIVEKYCLLVSNFTYNNLITTDQDKDRSCKISFEDLYYYIQLGKSNNLLLSYQLSIGII